VIISSSAFSDDVSGANHSLQASSHPLPGKKYLKITEEKLNAGPYSASGRTLPHAVSQSVPSEGGILLQN